MPTRIHPELVSVFPRFAAALAQRPGEPYLVEHVLPPASDADICSLEAELSGVVQLGSQHPFFHPLRRADVDQGRG